MNRTLLASLACVFLLTACNNTPTPVLETPPPGVVMSPTPIVLNLPKSTTFSYATKAGEKGSFGVTVESIKKLENTKAMTKTGREYYLASMTITGNKNNIAIKREGNHTVDPTFKQFYLYMYQEGFKGFNDTKPNDLKDVFAVEGLPTDRKHLSEIVITDSKAEKVYAVFPVVPNTSPSLLAFAYFDKDKTYKITNTYFSLIDGKQWSEENKQVGDVEK